MSYNPGTKMDPRTVVALIALALCLVAILSGCAPSIPRAAAPLVAPASNSQDTRFIDLLNSDGFGYATNTPTLRAGLISVAKAGCGVLDAGGTVESAVQIIEANSNNDDAVAHIYINAFAAGVVVYCPSHATEFNVWIGNNK